MTWRYISMKMDHLMSQQESYANRRELFKNIWDTSIHIDEKDDILNKPKVIKTLRLDEIDRCVTGKRKKQRIKNLRTVCNKLLDFCDRQDADDLYYQQMVVQDKGLQSTATKRKIVIKKRILKVRKNIKEAKSMLPAKNDITARATNSEPRDDFQNILRKTISRSTSPIKVKRNSISFAANSGIKQGSGKISPKSIQKKALGKSRKKKSKPSIP